MNQQLPPAGWFPDPQVPGQLRYWNGSSWTAHVAPAVATPPAAAPPAPAAPASVAPVVTENPALEPVAEVTPEQPDYGQSTAEPSPTTYTEPTYTEPAQPTYTAPAQPTYAAPTAAYGTTPQPTTYGTTPQPTAYGATPGMAAPPKRSMGCVVIGLVAAVAVVLLIVGAISMIVALRTGGGEIDGQTEPQPSETSSTWTPSLEGAPDFKPVDKSGKGNATIKLPAGTGILTLVTSKDAALQIKSTSADGERADLSYFAGPASPPVQLAFGISKYEPQPATITIEGSGKWILKVSPLNTAAHFTRGAMGNASGVFIYDGDAATWTLKHKGEGNFIVVEYDKDWYFNLLANEIEPSTLTADGVAGPALVTVFANGPWSITTK